MKQVRIYDDLLNHAKREMGRTGLESDCEMEWNYWRGRVEVLEELKVLEKLLK